MTFLVVDDFCDQIDEVRQSSLNAGFDTWNPNKGEVGSSIYDGMGFWGDHATMLQALARAIGGAPVPNTLYFRTTNIGTEQAYIHSDRESGNHTCVAYMTEHEEESGTAFFMHKKSGLRHMPSMAEMRELGIMDAMREDMVSRDPDKWVQTDFVKGIKNRALIFDAPLFHSRFPLEGIGTTTETGRMVWVSHFYKMRPNGELF